MRKDDEESVALTVHVLVQRDVLVQRNQSVEIRPDTIRSEIRVQRPGPENLPPCFSSPLVLVPCSLHVSSPGSLSSFTDDLDSSLFHQPQPPLIFVLLCCPFSSDLPLPLCSPLTSNRLPKITPGQFPSFFCFLPKRHVVLSMDS